ncbi:MAG: YceD family protein [Leadbetterella sp.]
MNKDLVEFDLNIHGLEEKTYTFDIGIDGTFFENYDQDVIKGGDVNVHITLQKSSHILSLDFAILAQVDLECDRTLEIFREAFHIQEKHIFKFGDSFQELTEDMTMIRYGTPKINVADHVFDYIFLAIPVRKIHPDYRKEVEDEETLYYEDEKPTEENTEVDPRWEKLMKLKNNN